jgi:acetoin utilization deacetylase AcuC-like enzyme
MNLPVMPGSGDGVYRELFEERVVPGLEEFRPEVVMVSAGFDAHVDDPLAQVELGDESYEWMTREIVGVAERHSGGRVISALEGGYHLRALGRSVVRHLAALR